MEFLLCCILQVSRENCPVEYYPTLANLSTSGISSTLANQGHRLQGELVDLSACFPPSGNTPRATLITSSAPTMSTQHLEISSKTLPAKSGLPQGGSPGPVSLLSLCLYPSKARPQTQPQLDLQDCTVSLAQVQGGGQGPKVPACDSLKGSVITPLGQSLQGATRA